MRSRHLATAAAVATAMSLGWAAMAGERVPPPTEVLVGTEIGDIADYPTVAASEGLAGAFEAETGGARQTLELTPTGEGAWRVERRVIEPGEPPFRRVYEAVREGGVLRGPAGDIELRPVADGIIVLESRDDIVPPDLWILYVRQ